MAENRTTTNQTAATALNRRAVLAGGAAAGTVAAIGAGKARGSEVDAELQELERLIAAHKEARDAADKAIDPYRGVPITDPGSLQLGLRSTPLSAFSASAPWRWLPTHAGGLKVCGGRWSGI